MTAISYPDFEAHSSNGKFTLEVRSPHNGTINHPDGSPPSDDEFAFVYREHQSDFRYRLLANPSGGPPLSNRDQMNVVWEGWQDENEDSPHDAVVSDDGWSIVRTHGFRPEVIVVSPSGEDVLHVQITGVGAEHHSSDPSANVYSWSPRNLRTTTAGLFWTAYSRNYFFNHQRRQIFVWRTSWGQRLLIDLESSALIPDGDPSESLLMHALVEQEMKEVCDLLEALSTRMAGVRAWLDRSRVEASLDGQVCSVRSAIHLVGLYPIASCIPFLRQWEEIDCPVCSTSSTAMKNWSLEVQQFRPILHHSLRLLDEEPRGFATYHFLDYKKQRVAMPERLIDRRARMQRLSRELSAEQVLRLLGSPDHHRIQPHWDGKTNRWTEDWEYDFRMASGWITWRITWKDGEQKGVIASIEELPAYWLQSDQRETEILDQLW